MLIAFSKELKYKLPIGTAPTLENHPLAMSVYKARQAMANEDNWDGRASDKPHGLTPEEIAEIIKNLSDPTYLVYEKDSKNFAEIVRFTKNGSKEKAYAIIAYSDEDKNPEYMNGYRGGKYNIFVTTYPSENSFELKKYLKCTDNIVITGEEMKKKAPSQRGSGSHVPSHLNDNAFFDNSISHPDENVNTKSALSGKADIDLLEGNVKAGKNKKSSGRAETRSANSAINKSTSFIEDKYYSRQIDKWDEIKEGSYIVVGQIGGNSILRKIGVPARKVFFDVSNIKKHMDSHSDHLDVTTLKKIPDLLNNPIAITEYSSDKTGITISVYGELYINDKPVVVGVVVRQGNGGNIISKITTVHVKRDLSNQITDDKILYLRENKKEVNAWFQAIGGIDVPLGGTQLGVIRSINLDNIVSRDNPIVNTKSALSGKV